MASLLLLLSMSLTTICGATHVDLKKLHRDLMENYNKNLRPTFNLSQPTEVDIQFYLLSIKEFDEKTSRFAIVGVFVLNWNDFQLAWDPDDYGGIVSTVFPQNTLWKPDLILMNPYEKVESAGFEDLKIVVINNGSVFWAPVDVYEVTCPADVTYYPFDQQTCSLFFSVYMYTVFDVTLKPSSTHIFTDDYSPNSLWYLKDTSFTIIESHNSQTLLMKTMLQRGPLFQVINTIVPFNMLGLLNIMVFLLPAESGERVGFSVTILLAIAVFMTIVADTLPGTSEPSFPRLCYLLIAQLGVNMLVTVFTILISRLHHKPKQQNIPSWLQKIIGKCVCFHPKFKLINSNENINNQDLNNPNIDSLETVVSIVQEAKNVDLGDEVNHRPRKGVKHTCSKMSWQTVVSFLDVFSFLFFLVIYVSSMIATYFVFC
ncbi:acetylcholine receptor subunit beta-like [Ylistrum balloti]|uniref:acetylcholine receptor subunit beta-like n=1 Tax=Ylistrum balloti TaxID=509963 RepID=UPI0029058C5F|nr:acetylcholine receptor subunit beta-like [Ylistrum balloti]